MTTTIDYLEALKIKLGVTSDYALAPKLGLTRQMISLYRLKREYFGDAICLEVARLLGLDPAIVLSSVHAERAKTDSEKSAWLKLFERVGGLDIDLPKQAKPRVSAGDVSSSLYIMLNCLQGKLSPFKHSYRLHH